MKSIPGAPTGAVIRMASMATECTKQDHFCGKPELAKLFRKPFGYKGDTFDFDYAPHTDNRQQLRYRHNSYPATSPSRIAIGIFTRSMILSSGIRNNAAYPFFKKRGGKNYVTREQSCIFRMSFGVFFVMFLNTRLK